MNWPAGLLTASSKKWRRDRASSLASLATLPGVPTDEQPVFFALVHALLVPSDDATTVVVLQAIQEAMSGHPLLVKTATH